MLKLSSLRLKYLAAFLVLLAVGCGERFDSYYDPGTNVRIKYPAKWQVVEKKDNTLVAFISPKKNEVDAFQENVNIVVQDLSANPMTLKQYSTLAIQQIKVVYNNVDILSSGSILLSNKPAFEVEYLVKAEFNLKIHQMWLLDNYKSYIISFISDEAQYDALKETVKDMASSFSIDK